MAINVFILLRINTVSMDVKICKHISYFFGDISVVLFQSVLRNEKDEKLWLDKKVWILGEKEDSSIIGNRESSPSSLGEGVFSFS